MPELSRAYKNHYHRAIGAIHGYLQLNLHLLARLADQCGQAVPAPDLVDAFPEFSAVDHCEQGQRKKSVKEKSRQNSVGQKRRRVTRRASGTAAEASNDVRPGDSSTLVGSQGISGSKTIERNSTTSSEAAMRDASASPLSHAADLNDLIRFRHAQARRDPVRLRLRQLQEAAAAAPGLSPITTE